MSLPKVNLVGIAMRTEYFQPGEVVNVNETVRPGAVVVVLKIEVTGADVTGTPVDDVSPPEPSTEEDPFPDPHAVNTTRSRTVAVRLSTAIDRVTAQEYPGCARAFWPSHPNDS